MPEDLCPLLLFALVDDLNKVSVFLLVLLDLSLVFDTINRGVFYDCVGAFRHCFAVILFLPYGSDPDGVTRRHQFVSLAIDLWVLQGSFLTPVLLNIYTKLLEEFIQGFR